jgi:hypothetical protein
MGKYGVSYVSDVIGDGRDLSSVVRLHDDDVVFELLESGNEQYFLVETIRERDWGRCYMSKHKKSRRYVSAIDPRGADTNAKDGTIFVPRLHLVPLHM